VVIGGDLWIFLLEFVLCVVNPVGENGVVRIAGRKINMER